MKRRIASQAVAGIWVFVVLAAPAMVTWWAGDNGSLGDLSELELLATGLLLAVAASVLAGWLMGRALDIADAQPHTGRLDPWAALFAATAVLGTVVTLLPATTLVLLLPEEDSPIGARVHWVALVWIAGAAGAAALSIWVGRALLTRHRRGGR
jgi:hypothetical protein